MYVSHLLSHPTFYILMLYFTLKFYTLILYFTKIRAFCDIIKNTLQIFEWLHFLNSFGLMSPLFLETVLFPNFSINRQQCNEHLQQKTLHFGPFPSVESQKQNSGSKGTNISRLLHCIHVLFPKARITFYSLQLCWVCLSHCISLQDPMFSYFTVPLLW